MCQTQKAEIVLFRSTQERGRGEQASGRLPKHSDGFDGGQLLCRRCGQQITCDSQRINVGSAHEHTVTNPDGILFHIGCFGQVQGCRFCGELTSQWSWFKQYQWRVTYCVECNLHLGWYFSSGEHVFHGLVLRNLSKLA